MVKLYKKATVSMIVELTIIIGLILAVVLLLMVGALHAGVESQSTERDICKASVGAQSVVMAVNENIIQPDCKTYNVNFYDNRVELDGKRKAVYDSREKAVVTKFDGLTNEIVNQVIAEELRGCWYQFLEGKKSLFSMAFIFATNGYSCFVCSEINFDSEIQQSQFTGFYDYLKSKTMPNAKMTYYDYIAEQPRLSEVIYNKDENGNAWEEYAEGVSYLFSRRDPITTDINFGKQKYVVVFIREGEGTRADKAITKAITETYFSYVIPFEDLKEQCTTMMRGSVK